MNLDSIVNDLWNTIKKPPGCFLIPFLIPFLPILVLFYGLFKIGDAYDESTKRRHIEIMEAAAEIRANEFEKVKKTDGDYTAKDFYDAEAEKYPDEVHTTNNMTTTNVDVDVNMDSD